MQSKPILSNFFALIITHFARASLPKMKPAFIRIREIICLFKDKKHNTALKMFIYSNLTLTPTGNNIKFRKGRTAAPHFLYFYICSSMQNMQ